MADREVPRSWGAAGSGQSTKPGRETPEPPSRWGIPLIFLAAIVALWLGFRMVPDLGGLVEGVPIFSSPAPDEPRLPIRSVTDATPTPSSTPTSANGQDPQTTPTSRTAVPDLLQLSEERAIALLEQHRLTADIVEVFNDSVAPGRVVGQFPERNTEVDEGSTVTIRLSKGPEDPIMPDVVTKTVVNAREQLQLLGVEVEEELRGSDTVAAGEVMAQEPPAGTQVEAGSTVRLIVSKGVERFQVPDVRGKLLAIAQQELAKIGLRGVVGVTLKEDTGLCGTVASQSPQPGAEVTREFDVKLNIRAKPGCT